MKKLISHYSSSADFMFGLVYGMALFSLSTKDNYTHCEEIMQQICGMWTETYYDLEVKEPIGMLAKLMEKVRK